MNRAVHVCTLCAVLSSSWLANVDAQLRSEHDGGSIVQSIETLSKVVEGLQTAIRLQSSMLSNLVSKEELESILLNNLATKSDALMQETSFKRLEAKAAMHENSLSNLQVAVDEIKTFLLNSNVKTDEQVESLGSLQPQSTIQAFLLNDNVGDNLENQSSLVSNFLTKEEIQVNNLTDIEAKVATASYGLETLAERMENSTGSKGIVEGIIAGTYHGVVIIPLESREQRTISSSFTIGVAFNWSSRKVYWIEYGVGIKTADLDGSNVELLVSDGSFLSGLAVDQITGNLYYGYGSLIPDWFGESEASIRVCDSMGQKCVTVVLGVDNLGIFPRDIALNPSEGLMYWSSPYDKNTVTQANMDGTNATVILLEKVFGLYSDELTGKVYWAKDNGKSIQSYSLNGDIQTVELNITMDPNDLAVDGDTLYFGGDSPNGVASVTLSGEAASFSNTTGHVNHIVLYGRNKVFSRSNPCSNSPCANLCVLTRLSYMCL